MWGSLPMIGVRSGTPRCGYIGHVSILGGLRPTPAIFMFFSSIPTKRRNVEFKMDIRHSFQRL